MQGEMRNCTVNRFPINRTEFTSNQGPRKPNNERESRLKNAKTATTTKYQRNAALYDHPIIQSYPSRSNGAVNTRI